MTSTGFARATNEAILAMAVAALATTGCAGERSGRKGSGGGGLGSVGMNTDGGDGHDDTGAGSGQADGGDGGDGGDGAGSTFDIPASDDDGPTGGEEGCKKVDFLFVVDNSVSMADNQAALVGAFPEFMAAIQDTLAADSDYHVLVADTDAWGRCNTLNGWSGHDPSSNTCNDYIQTTPFLECDRELGAGVIHPAGESSSNEHCMTQNGTRYLEPGEADLPGTFSCMATVGVAGHPQERPMDAMVAALAPAINGPGGCNEGFVRDDALLVITFMSDDPNYEDAMGPNEWYEAVLDAKLGDPTSTVVLGLTPDWDGCQDGKGPPKGSHWSEFIGLWGDNGLHGDVCGTAQEYVSFFEMAVSTIDQACNSYNPPG